MARDILAVDITPPHHLNCKDNSQNTLAYYAAAEIKSFITLAAGVGYVLPGEVVEFHKAAQVKNHLHVRF